MRLQVLRDPLAECQRRRTTAGKQPSQPVLKRPLRLSPATEPAHLQPRRTAARDAIPVGPQRFPVRGPRLQLEHLTLLNHRRTFSIDNRIEESHPRSDDDDHPFRREVVEGRSQVHGGGGIWTHFPDRVIYRFSEARVLESA